MRREIVGIYAGRRGAWAVSVAWVVLRMDWYLIRQTGELSERLDIDGSGANCECSRMYASCVLIGPATLRRMYVEELRTTDQTAAHFGCSGTTVLRHLWRFKIPVRPRGPCVDWVRLRKGLSPTLPEWSADVAYVIGL